MRSRATRIATPRLKLTIEPMPEVLFRENLRTQLGKGRWDKLRRTLGKKSCEVCAATDRLEAHEVWSYREGNPISVAKLLRIKVLCKDCHFIVHWFNTQRLFCNRKGILAALQRHFCRVNKCRRADFSRHEIRRRILLHSRSSLHWHIDWGKYKPVIEAAKKARDARRKTHPISESRADYEPLRPGDHMPRTCPHCGSASVRFVRQDTSDMSEAEEADYEAGIWGFIQCNDCGRGSGFGF